MNSISLYWLTYTVSDTCWPKNRMIWTFLSSLLTNIFSAIMPINSLFKYTLTFQNILRYTGSCDITKILLLKVCLMSFPLVKMSASWELWTWVNEAVWILIFLSVSITALQKDTLSRHSSCVAMSDCLIRVHRDEYFFLLFIYIISYREH